MRRAITAMEAIKQSSRQITRITDVIADIANSAREQPLGLSGINTGVKQLDDVTQRTAAVVVQSTQSAVVSAPVRLAAALSPTPAPRPAPVPDLVTVRQTGTGGPLPLLDE